MTIFWIVGFMLLCIFVVIFDVFWSKSRVLGRIGRSGKVLGFISFNFGPNPTAGRPPKGNNRGTVIVCASRIPPRRPRTLRTWLRSARNFGKTRFGRFAIFEFLTPKKNFRKNYSVENFFFGFFLVFHHFRQILEDLRICGRQNQIPRGILLQMVKFSGP